MFTLNHFIWLGIVLVIIIGFLLVQKNKNISFDNIMTFMFIMSIISELIKIFSNMIETTEGGTVLNPADLPFHLCSIQIFFIFALKFLIKTNENKEKLLGLMAPTMLLGGLLALFIPTVGVEFTDLQVYQFFVFHACIIAFSIYVLIERLVNYNWKTFGRNIGYLGLLTLIATWINSILSVTNPKVNFFFLCRPPMENLPVLNLNHGWYVYFITIVAIAFICMFIFHLIVIALYNRNKQN